MHTRKIIILFCFSLLTALVSIGSFVYLLNIIENKNIHTKAVLKTLESKNIEKENTDLLEKKIAEVASVGTMIDEHLVDPKKINIFVDYLEKFGETHNTELTVTDVAVSEAVKNQILVKISLRGGFTEVMKSIALLENDRYQIHIISTYINQEISNIPAQTQSTTAVPVAPVEKKPIWQADISFSVISSS